MVKWSLSKSAMKSTKDEHSDETPIRNWKRKHLPQKENEFNTKKYSENLVGLWLRFGRPWIKC